MAILQNPKTPQAVTREDYDIVPLGTIVGVEVSETEPTNPLTEIWIKPSEGNQDFVVDYGTSGIWTYRKWNSGIAECWTTNTQLHSFPNTSAWGNIFETPSAISYTYPDNLFVAEPNHFISKVGGAAGWVEPGANSSKTRTSDIYICFGKSKTTTFNINLSCYAIGRWK